MSLFQKMSLGKALGGAGVVLGGAGLYYSLAGGGGGGPLKNHAFVFIKPHAVTDKTKALAKSGLEAKGLKVLKHGNITGEIIDQRKLIDQHYYAIAVKGTIKKPTELNVPNDKFKAHFGLDWSAALASGKVFNALDGCKELGIDADGMDKCWAQSKKDGNLCKLGGGFYCGIVKHGGKEIYVMNGFFMAMRSKFTKPGTEIYYYTVEWDPAKMPWSAFRGDLLGPTDPADAPADSLRGKILKDWQALGLAACPNVGDNGMHASASPFEALAERNNWLQVPFGSDPFGKACLDAGIKESTLKDWSVDPQVNLGNGKKGSIFDALEDMDSDNCVKRMLELSKIQ